MTARDLIRRALRLGGVIAAGETPSAEELNDSLADLNDMLDSFSNENLMIYANSIEQFPLINGQKTYGMGPSGDFDTVRPMGIDGVGLIVGDVEVPLQLLTIDEWQLVRFKTLLSTLPMKVYCEPKFPLYELNFYPGPSSVNNVVIYSHKQLLNFASADTAVNLPPGYNQLLIYNLWIVLAPGYGRPVDSGVAAVASKAKSNVKRTNVKPRVMRTDPGVHNRRRYNVYRGD